MKVLSLYDGMSCGMLAMNKAGIKVDRYVAYEIDKYAVQTSSYNFPMIEHKGDVFKADFKEYAGFDLIVGGSPCTYWSIAQTKHRETVASGMGWELFSQYVRAIHEVKPKYFLYENNKSMSNAIRESISEAFGFEPICINSALVSAQTRKRLYWCGVKQEDGTYKKADIQQPEDRGILLRDILDTSFFHEYSIILNRNDRPKINKPICVNSKSGRGGINGLQPSIQNRIYSGEGKSTAVTTSFITKVTEKLPPCFRVKEATTKGYVDIKPGNCVDMSMPNSKTRRGRSMEQKSNCMQTSCEFYEYCGTINQPIYEVKDGIINVNGKEYPVKLIDGLYIIRKLNVSECMRLQTVPENYKWPVSNAQAYKMLGNGWTVEVIVHLLKGLLTEKVELKNLAAGEAQLELLSYEELKAANEKLLQENGKLKSIVIKYQKVKESLKELIYE